VCNSYTDTKVSAEAKAREDADTALKSELMKYVDNSSSSYTTYIDEKIAAETTARTNADAALKTEVNKYTDTKVADTLSQAKAYTDSKVSAEATARTTAISEAISDEVTARNSAISTAISTEVSNRTTADNNLKTEVNKYTDTKVSAEATARTTAINTAKSEVKSYTDTEVSDALTEAKAYTDSEISALVNGAPETMNTLKELGDLINTNEDAIDALNEAIGKRALSTDLTTHTGNATVHITSIERTNWNAAKTHADSAHAPANAEANQNAFSNIIIGSTTIAADSKTDNLILEGSNVTLTPDATNDKVTIGITKANVISALGYTPASSNVVDTIDIDYTQIEFDTTKVL
jgi:hypothetical protein